MIVVVKFDNILVDMIIGFVDFHRNEFRVFHEIVDDLFNGAGHGCAETEGLTIERKLGGDFADISDESHVEHAVSLVEHERLHVVEVQLVATDQILEASGRANDDMWTALKRADLVVDVHTTDTEGRKELHTS